MMAGQRVAMEDRPDGEPGSARGVRP